TTVGNIGLVGVVTTIEVSGAVHYPATGLDGLGGAATKHQRGCDVVVDDIGEMIHDHVVQARCDRPVLRFGQDPDEEVVGLGGQPCAEFCAYRIRYCCLVGAVVKTGCFPGDAAHQRAAPPSPGPGRVKLLAACEERARTRHEVHFAAWVFRDERVRGIHRGLTATDDPHRHVARPHFVAAHIAV